MRQSILLTVFSVILMCLSAIPASAGKLDPNFGTGGTAHFDVQNGIAATVGVQADGKLVFAGEFNYKFGVLRVNADGTRDTSFGTNGLVRTTIFLRHTV